ncbi:MULTISPECIES: antitoxin Xre/MbcA/ParS toxin-binding domain-containing protein [Deefgea]|nr:MULTISPECIES: antitoxin Xre/MbcA/ParS toxin-binding domain-containing protein [Deefgea]MBM9890239.1 DUF2384 domain-containing protein [Deefgea sp. CFH1-16]
MIATNSLLASKPLRQIKAIRIGLDAREIEKLVVHFKLHPVELASMLGLSIGSLRYRVRQGLRLDSVASERLLRLARVANHAATIFGDSISAGDWLLRPHSMLDNATPLSMLDTAYGAQEVERILYSIEHGLPV